MLNLKIPRLFFTLAIAVLLLAAIFLVAPQQLPVSLYKLSLVTLAAVVGYWLDRELFPYGRPDQYLKGGVSLGFAPESVVQQYNAATLRRAIIVASIILAVSLGA